MMAIPPSSEPGPAAAANPLPPWLKWGLLSSLWLVVSAVYALQVSAVGLLPWSGAVTLALLDWAPWIAFGPLALWLARKMPIGPKTWRWSLPAHLLACVLLVALMELTMSALSLRRDLLVPPPDRPNAAAVHPGPPEPLGAVRFAWLRILDRARTAVPVYWMLVAGAHALAHQRRSLERERRALHAEAGLAEARLSTLQAQLNPHFLFNTLNTIAHFVYTDPAAAEETISSLSELLRSALNAQQRREVALGEEIAFVKRYCEIQKARFGDRLEMRYEIAPDTLGAPVPALLLLPLVENAIIHGVARGPEPGAVFIRARRRAERLVIEVADTGGGSGPANPKAGPRLDFREGVGLANTRARLAALYGERQAFGLERAPEGGVLARVEIPMNPPPA
ncbi:MAG: histidine kinase [Opitutaceae bacterium]|jgi:hypothetical protein